MGVHQIKQLLFGTKNCTCNRRRKDGLHNTNCASWKNAWFPKRYQARVTDLLLKAQKPNAGYMEAQPNDSK